MRRHLRALAALTLVIYAFGLGAPVLNAQYAYEDQGGYNDDYFVSQVHDTLASRDQLEETYTAQAQRSAQAQAAINELQSMEPPAGWDQDEWVAMVNKRVKELQGYSTENQSIMSRTKAQLQSTYDKITGFQSTIKSSNNPQVQGLGTLVGVAGTAVVPIWSRPTFQGALATAGQTARQANVATIGARIGQGPGTNTGLYGRVAGAATNNAASAAAAVQAAGSTHVAWTPTVVGEGAAARYVLNPTVEGTYFGNNPPKAVTTSVPALRQTASGEWVKNPAAERYAMDLASQRNSASSINLSIAKLKNQASNATNSAVRDQLNKRITALEAKRGELNGEINQYNSTNQSFAQKAKAVGVSAAKWAGMSVAISVGANAVSQMAEKGWDPRNIDWGDATAHLKTKEFWGGTAGSFGGSMLGSAIGAALPAAIPGGQFLRIGLAVGGAALGWSVGSGQGLKDMDWVKFGATTVGSTIGIVLGSTFLAFLGPFGPMIGGIAGHLIASWLVDKVRAWGMAKNISFDRPYSSSNQQQASSGNPDVGSTYTGSSPYDTGYGSSYSYGSGGPVADVSSVNEERVRVREELMAAINATPPDMAKARECQARLTELNNTIGATAASQYNR